MTPQDEPGLLLLWATTDRETALNMLFMYGLNSRLQGWWDKVRLLVWGPSARLLAADEELRARVREMRDAGVDVMACKACADRYGVAQALEAAGITVVYTGEPLTRMLKEGWKLISL